MSDESPKFDTVVQCLQRYWHYFYVDWCSTQLAIWVWSWGLQATFCVRNGIAICCSLAQKSLCMKEVIIAWQICSVVIKVTCPTTVFPPKVSKSCIEGEKVDVGSTKFEQDDVGVLFWSSCALITQQLIIWVALLNQSPWPFLIVYTTLLLSIFEVYFLPSSSQNCNSFWGFLSTFKFSISGPTQDFFGPISVFKDNWCGVCWLNWCK